MVEYFNNMRNAILVDISAEIKTTEKVEAKSFAGVKCSVEHRKKNKNKKTGKKKKNREIDEIFSDLILSLKRLS